MTEAIGINTDTGVNFTLNPTFTFISQNCIARYLSNKSALLHHPILKGKLVCDVLQALPLAQWNTIQGKLRCKGEHGLRGGAKALLTRGGQGQSRRIISLSFLCDAYEHGTAPFNGK